MAQPPTRRNLSSSLYLCLPHSARDTKPAGRTQDLEVCGGDPGSRFLLRKEQKGRGGRGSQAPTVGQS